MKWFLHRASLALFVMITLTDLKAQAPWMEYPIAPDYGALEDIDVLNDSVTVSVGERGCVVRSSSRTLYFDRLTLIRRIVPNTNRETLRSVTFTTGEDFVAVGDDGRSIRGNAVGGRIEATTLPTRTRYTAVAAHGNTVLAGGEAGNLASSSDGGGTWQAVVFPTTEDVYDISFENDTWYVLTSTSVYASNNSTWTRLDVPTVTQNLRFLSSVYQTTNGTQLFICDEAEGVWTSTDQGTTWTRLYPRQNFANTYTVEAFDVDRTGTKMAMIIGDATQRRNMLTSLDGGTTWQNNSKASVAGRLQSLKWTPSGYIVACAMLADIPLFSGTSSGDFSASRVLQHSRINSAVEWNGEFIVSMSNGVNFIIVSVDSAFQRPSKMLWSGEGNDPVLCRSTNALFLSFNRNEGRQGFVCRSTDDGKSWLYVSDPVQRNQTVNVKTFGSTVLLRDTRSNGLYSSDDGETWTISPSASERIARYPECAFINATSWIEQGFDIDESRSRWARTTDAGITWTSLDDGPPVSDVVMVNGNLFGVASLLNDGQRRHIVNISRDLGTTWSTIYENVPSGWTGDPRRIIASGNRLVMFGHSKALYLSDDGGLHWRHDTTASSLTAFYHNAAAFSRQGRVHLFSDFANVVVEGSVPTTITDFRMDAQDIVRVSDNEFVVTNAFDEPVVQLVDILGRSVMLKAHSTGDGQWRIVVPYNLRQTFLVINGTLLKP